MIVWYIEFFFAYYTKQTNVGGKIMYIIITMDYPDDHNQYLLQPVFTRKKKKIWQSPAVN